MRLRINTQLSISLALLAVTAIFAGGILYQDYMDKRYWNELTGIRDNASIEKILSKKIDSAQDRQGNEYHLLNREPYPHGLFRLKAAKPLEATCTLPHSPFSHSDTMIFFYHLYGPWYLYQENTSFNYKIIPRNQQCSALTAP